MNWIEIKKWDIPVEEVITIDSFGNCLVGHLDINQFGVLVCESNTDSLPNVTHYSFITEPK